MYLFKLVRFTPHPPPLPNLYDPSLNHFPPPRQCCNEFTWLMSVQRSQFNTVLGGGGGVGWGKKGIGINFALIAFTLPTLSPRIVCLEYVSFTLITKTKESPFSTLSIRLLHLTSWLRSFFDVTPITQHKVTNKLLTVHHWVNGINPRVSVVASFSGIVWVKIVPKRSVVGDWRFAQVTDLDGVSFKVKWLLTL